MIQRIQSIFYLISGLCFAGLFKFPFATSDVSIPQLLSDRVYNVMDNIVLIILALAGAIISIVAIFLFKNRTMQIRSGYIIIILSILTPLVAFLLIYNEQTAVRDASGINDEPGIFLPVVALIFAFLANRFVKKDDKLVKSMDRLR